MEQENDKLGNLLSEVVEDAVEMLTLIASNRGQREERTVDEKLQEIKYLESFAKAIYNQKCRGIRGRFRDLAVKVNLAAILLQKIKSAVIIASTEKTTTALRKPRWYFSKAAAFSQLGGMFYGYEKKESA